MPQSLADTEPRARNPVAAPNHFVPSKTTLGSPKSRSQMSGRGATAALRSALPSSAPTAGDEPGASVSRAGSVASAVSAPAQRIR